MLFLMGMDHEILGNTDLETIIADFVCKKCVVMKRKITGKQPAATELTRRDHSTDTRLHYHYME